MFLIMRGNPIRDPETIEWTHFKISNYDEDQTILLNNNNNEFLEMENENNYDKLEYNDEYEDDSYDE